MLMSMKQGQASTQQTLEVSLNQRSTEQNGLFLIVVPCSIISLCFPSRDVSIDSDFVLGVTALILLGLGMMIGCAYKYASQIRALLSGILSSK